MQILRLPQIEEVLQCDRHLLGLPRQNLWQLRHPVQLSVPCSAGSDAPASSAHPIAMFSYGYVDTHIPLHIQEM